MFSGRYNYRAIQQFLSWCERAGYQDLEDIEPITVAAYIETLQRQAAPATVKQHMAAIRMLFSWLTEKGVLAMNPAREVKTERCSRTEGKTPAFVDGEVQRLITRLRHPRTPACAIALCSGFLPTPSPGSAPS
jgi:site-specific recombinase XerD